MNTSSYLISALAKEGVTKIFGIPGDYIISFFSEIDKQEGIDYVITTREDAAAFAADGYARCHGLGAVAVTYGVGALNIVNPVAGAMSEMSPVVIISGAPGVTEQDNNLILHHKFGPYSFQRDVFSKITCYTTVLDNPETAAEEIQRAILMAKKYSKPVYIEIPRDLLLAEISTKTITVLPADLVDQDILGMATVSALDLIYNSTAPIILAGVEIHRFKLQSHLNNLQRKTGFPIASTISGKSVFNEKSDYCVGVYGGALGSPLARKFVEESDCLIMLGGELNDVDTGIYTARLPEKIIKACGNTVYLDGYSSYSGIPTKTFIKALADRIKVYPDVDRYKTRDQISISSAAMILEDRTVVSEPTEKITIKYLMGFLNKTLPRESIVVADTGDALFSGIDLEIDHDGIFIASGFYTTMGFAVPAALGAALTKPHHKIYVLVGDGAFQMTGTEISTIVKLGIHALIIVINNDGYSTERFIIDGPFNDVSNWNYEGLQHVIPGLPAHRIETVGDLHNFHWNGITPTLLNVVLDRSDGSESMKSLAREFAKRLIPKEK